LNRLSISAATLVLAALALQACEKPGPAPAISGARLYSHDMEGKASLCAVPNNVLIVDGKDNALSMTTGGNGWCGIPLRGPGGAYSAGLLTQHAQNGKVYVHTVGDDTRIDYIPKAGTVVADTFVVRLIPGDAIVRVTVTPPGTPAGTPPVTTSTSPSPVAPRPAAPGK
jgi:hypothetical protein